MPPAKKPVKEGILTDITESADAEYPRITITFLPNKIQVNIEKLTELRTGRIQKSFREVYREYNLQRKKLIREAGIKARKPTKIEEKEDA